MKSIVEFRWHGRGGQGAWTASELLARTALDEGKYIQSYPEFGPERMGAPVTAFTRISTQPIRLHCAVYDPDVVVVLDNTLLKSVPVTSGLNENDNVLTNISLEEPSKFKKELTHSPKEVLHDRHKRISLRILDSMIANSSSIIETCISKIKCG